MSIAKTDEVGRSMPLELVASNSVIVAHQFNPSIVKDLWLVRHSVLEEGDFRPGCVYTDVVARVFTANFQLLVVPQQCQFTPLVDAELQQHLLVEKLGAIVQALPHTPYRAIGLNFTWHLVPSDDDIPAISRGLFYLEDGPLHREFSGVDARFGAYMSKDAFGGRLTLDAKPIVVNEHEDNEQERVQFAFNLHRDVGNEHDPVGAINQVLHRWDDMRKESSRIVRGALKGGLV